MALPTVALVGRPNVGKSTLFNRLTKTRGALVADFPGLTRDRHYGRAHSGDQAYFVVDTGGYEPVATSGILHEMAKQTRQAIAESDVVVFLVDGRNGLAPQDREIAELLRRSGRKGCSRNVPSPSSTSWGWASRSRYRRRTARTCAR